MKVIPRVGCMVVFMVISGALALRAQNSQEAGRANTIWEVQPSADPGRAFNVLDGVAALSVNDVFAVGAYALNAEGTNGIPLVEHWNGSTWTNITTPKLPSRFCTETTALNAVAAVSNNDVWAVGNCTFRGPKLIEHWDGRVWKIISAPNPPCTSSAALNAVTAISSTDVWAVGYYQTCQELNLPLTLHWDGSNWTVISAPRPAGNANPAIRAVAASSPDDVWMVGFTDPGNTAIIEHWNGTAWSLVPSTASNIQLNGVVALSPADAWAVGSSLSCPHCQMPLIEHWDGSRWTVVPTHTETLANLTAVTAGSSSNIWAVGYTGDVSQPETLRTFTMHWNGMAWSAVPSPSPDTLNELFGTDALGGGAVWTVGVSVDSNQRKAKALVLFTPGE